MAVESGAPIARHVPDETQSRSDHVLEAELELSVWEFFLGLEGVESNAENQGQMRRRTPLVLNEKGELLGLALRVLILLDQEPETGLKGEGATDDAVRIDHEARCVHQRPIGRSREADGLVKPRPAVVEANLDLVSGHEPADRASQLIARRVESSDSGSPYAAHRELDAVRVQEIWITAVLLLRPEPGSRLISVDWGALVDRPEIEWLLEVTCIDLEKVTAAQRRAVGERQTECRIFVVVRDHAGRVERRQKQRPFPLLSEQAADEVLPLVNPPAQLTRPQQALRFEVVADILPVGEALRADRRIERSEVPQPVLDQLAAQSDAKIVFGLTQEPSELLRGFRGRLQPVVAVVAEEIAAMLVAT